MVCYVHDNEKNAFFCEWCEKGNKTNIFTLGKDASSPKRDDFEKHQSTKDHKLVAAGDRQKESMTKAIVTANNSAKNAIKAQMATVLVQAIEVITTSKNSKLLELQIFNVSCNIITFIYIARPLYHIYNIIIYA
jgi:hypothetical protein